MCIFSLFYVRAILNISFRAKFSRDMRRRHKYVGIIVNVKIVFKICHFCKENPKISFGRLYQLSMESKILLSETEYAEVVHRHLDVFVSSLGLCKVSVIAIVIFSNGLPKLYWHLGVVRRHSGPLLAAQTTHFLH